MELEVNTILKRHQFFTNATADYNGPDGDRAPLLKGLFKARRLPDLDACKGGVRWWLEIKGKASSSWYLKGFTEDHGIDLACFNDYLAVQEATGTPVWLIIKELGRQFLEDPTADKWLGGKVLPKPQDLTRTGGVCYLYQSLDWLKQAGPRESHIWDCRMVYWPRSVFIDGGVNVHFDFVDTSRRGVQKHTIFRSDHAKAT